MTADKQLLGSKVLMIIAPEQWRDEELLEPKRIFQEQGAQVLVACRQLESAKGMLGARCSPDILIKEVHASEYDAFVVVGGLGSPAHLWEDAQLHRILQQAQKENKVLGAICLSGAVLARAGLLQNKNATVWACPESLEALERGKAKYKKDHVVQDGRVITADGPEVAGQFAMLIVKELARAKSAV